MSEHTVPPNAWHKPSLSDITPTTPTRPSLPPELRDALDEYEDASTASRRTLDPRFRHEPGEVAAQQRTAEARAALDAALLTIVQERDDWQEWASHQEGCLFCAESHPRDCGDGTLLWARCHPDNEEAQKIVAERDPRVATPEETPAHER